MISDLSNQVMILLMSLHPFPGTDRIYALWCFCDVYDKNEMTSLDSPQKYGTKSIKVRC